MVVVPCALRFHSRGGAEAQTRFEAASKQSNDPPLSRVNILGSGEDNIKLSELMNLCTSLQEKVLDLEKAKTAQAKEIASLKKRVKQLEKRRRFRPQEDASKQGRKITDLDADAKVTLVDETQEMNDDNLMFDTGVLKEQERSAEKEDYNHTAMMEADFELAQRLQAEEQGEITIEEGYIMIVLAGDELESDKSKNQKINEHVEAEKDDDPEEEEMKKHMEIIQNEEEIAIDAIPLATKPPMIVEYKIVKEGQKGFYHLIRADGSLKRYSSMIRMLRVWIRGRLRNFWNVGQRTSMELNRPA
ncbi:hypothetical protein Tco_0522414 [Tanacetum coccineum]